MNDATFGSVREKIKRSPLSSITKCLAPDILAFAGRDFIGTDWDFDLALCVGGSFGFRSDGPEVVASVRIIRIIALIEADRVVSLANNPSPGPSNHVVVKILRD